MHSGQSSDVQLRYLAGGGLRVTTPAWAKSDDAAAGAPDHLMRGCSQHGLSAADGEQRAGEVAAFVGGEHHVGRGERRGLSWSTDWGDAFLLSRPGRCSPRSRSPCSDPTSEAWDRRPAWADPAVRKRLRGRRLHRDRSGELHGGCHHRSRRRPHSHLAFSGQTPWPGWRRAIRLS